MWYRQSPRRLRSWADDFMDAITLEMGIVASFDSMMRKYAKEVEKSYFG